MGTQWEHIRNMEGKKKPLLPSSPKQKKKTGLFNSICTASSLVA